MDTPQTLSGSKDGQGAGDHDVPFPWGAHGEQRLHPWHWAHLLILRGHVQDARAGYSDNLADDLEPVLWPGVLP